MQPTLVSRPRRLAVKAHLFALRTSIMRPIHSAASPRNGWDGAVQPEEGATILPAMRLFLFLVAAISVAAAPAQPAPQQVWQMQDSGTTAGLRGIDSVDGTVAWASGTNGTVLRTIDAGVHWTQCAIPDAATDGATMDFRGVQAWDAQTAIVMASGPGDKSRLYKTTDGCKTWKLVFRNPDSPDGFFDCVWFQRTGYGILLGDPVKDRFAVFETADGGKTWKRDTRIGLNVKGTRFAAFAASNSLFPHFPNGYMRGFVTGGPGGALLVEAGRRKIG